MGPNPLFQLSFDCGRGVEGTAVIDTLLNGTSSGGVRITPDIRPDEVRSLASEMTLKYAFFGLPRGGAKCGIRVPECLPADERLTMMRRVGERLAAILQAGIYYPGMDMNCGEKELRAIYAGAGIQLPAKLTDSSFFTAVFVVGAVEATHGVLFSDLDRPASVAIEGFGSVGGHLVGRLPTDRYRVVAVSTVQGAVHDPRGFDPSRLTELRRAHGDDLVRHLPGERIEPKEHLLHLPVDILIPSARVGSIHESNVDHVQAKCIVPAANAPCTPSALASLHARGSVVLPGFVCNGGGVFGSSLADSGVTQSVIDDLSTGPYGKVVSALLVKSRELGCQPTALARAAALWCLQGARAQRISRAGRMVRRLARRMRPLRGLLLASMLPRSREHLERLAGFLGDTDEAAVRRLQVLPTGNGGEAERGQ